VHPAAWFLPRGERPVRRRQPALQIARGFYSFSDAERPGGRRPLLAAMAQRVRGILFDLGETLLIFGKVNPRSLFEAGAHLAYDYLQKLQQPLPAFEQYHRRHLWSIWWHTFKSKLTRREFNSLHLMRRHCRRMHLDLTDDQTLDVIWLFYRPLSQRAHLESETREALQRLTAKGITLGLISNTFFPRQTLDRHLEQEGLLELLPVRVYSSEVGFRKPNRRIFRIALERAALAAHETMFVGDMPRADIGGANRAGLISVLKESDQAEPNRNCKPDHRIRTIAELEGIVAEYNGAG
jgi:FMN phosphatase YigB (HAD superfamily)